MPARTDAEVFGEILREARYKVALTQDQLSDSTGIPQTTLSRLERGACPDPGVRDVIVLAEALEIELDDLIEPFRPRRPHSRRRPQLTQVAS